MRIPKAEAGGAEELSRLATGTQKWTGRGGAGGDEAMFQKGTSPWIAFMGMVMVPRWSFIWGGLQVVAVFRYLC